MILFKLFCININNQWWSIEFILLDKAIQSDKIKTFQDLHTYLEGIY